ncbi:MAG: class I SAM-dependent methyltransferase [Vampirovibrionales bacterium]|nr:class I SAM-dependent methyltransferase [Vampirovibrionales bacterium]
MAKASQADKDLTPSADIKRKPEEIAGVYEQWVYPAPLYDLQAYHDSGRIDAAAPQMAHALYWPDGRYQREGGEQISILVAGCGANAAARYAFEHPQARVVGIDVSASCLAHEESLKHKHNLENLSLYQMPVEDARTLDETFDFIEAVGVMNHLENPLAGMEALKTRLNPDGVIAVMLFGVYGRLGVGMLQKMFHRLDMGFSNEDVNIVRQTLAILDADHPVQAFNRNIADLQLDSGVVDCFLRSAGRNFTVEGCLQFARNSGLSFMGWLDNFPYYPEGQVPSNHPLYERIGKLPEDDMWKVMELFNGVLRNHTFYMCRKDRDAKGYKLDFDGDAFMDYVPIARINRYHQPDQEQGRPAMIERIPYRPVPLTPAQLAVYSRIDGKKNVRQCLEEAGLTGSPEDLTAFARNFFRSLWRLGYAMFLYPQEA